MLGNSFNLVDMIREYLTDDFTTRMSSNLGETRDKTHAALNASVPGILDAFDRAASTPDGARRLSSAIDDTDDSILNNAVGTFGKNVPREAGPSLLQDVLGGVGFSDLSATVRRASGLSGRSISLMLGSLVPLVLSVLKRAIYARGLTSSDVARLLSSQRTNIDAAMPEEFIEETYTPRSVPSPRVADTRPEARTEHSGRDRGAWILPVLLIAGALGLIWYLGNRPSVRAAREENNTIVGTKRSQDESRLGRTSTDALRNKYASVLQEAQAQGVQLSTVREENGKLILRGTAPSLDAANNVWAEIKRTNPNLDEISAYLSVTPSSASQAAPTQSTSERVENTPAESDARSYTVKPGDTLGSISKQFYGNSKDYKRIFNANQSRIQNQNLLQIGQELTIPMD